jgi:hypothetical protein
MRWLANEQSNIRSNTNFLLDTQFPVSPWPSAEVARLRRSDRLGRVHASPCADARIRRVVLNDCGQWSWERKRQSRREGQAALHRLDRRPTAVPPSRDRAKPAEKSVRLPRNTSIKARRPKERRCWRAPSSPRRRQRVICAREPIVDWRTRFFCQEPLRRPANRPAPMWTHRMTSARNRLR